MYVFLGCCLVCCLARSCLSACLAMISLSNFSCKALLFSCKTNIFFKEVLLRALIFCLYNKYRFLSFPAKFGFPVYSCNSLPLLSCWALFLYLCHSYLSLECCLAKPTLSVCLFSGSKMLSCQALHLCLCNNHLFLACCLVKPCFSACIINNCF